VLSPFLFAGFLWFSWPNRRRVFPPLIARTLRHYGHKSPSKNQFSKQQAGQKQKKGGEKERDIGSDDNNINFEAFICANKFNVRGERKREPDGIASEEKQQITGRKIHDNAQQ